MLNRLRSASRSVRSRLWLLLFLIAIGPLTVVGYLAYHSGRRTIERNVIHHLQSTNVLKAAEFERWIESGMEDLRDMAQRPGVMQNAAVLASRDPNEPEYLAAYDRLGEDRLTPTLEAKGGFRDLFILHADSGQILIATDRGLEGKFRESTPFFLEGRTHTYVGDAAFDLSSEQILMHISTPIEDGEGRLIAVLAGQADLGEVSAIMEQGTRLSASEDTYLVNSSNFFVTEPRFGDDIALRRAVRSEGVEACLQHEEGVVLYDDYGGVPVIGAYHWLPERGMCILTEVDQAEAYAPILNLRKAVVGISVVVAMAALAVGAVFARTITVPVRQLADGAAEIGRGNLGYRIGMQGEDVLARLAGALDVMAAGLQASLAQTARSQELLLALGQASQAVTRARTPEEVYRTVGDEVVSLGLNAVICGMTHDRKHLPIRHLTHEQRVVRAVEELLGVAQNDFLIRVHVGSIIDQVVSQRRTLFVEDTVEPMAQAMPRALRPLAGQLLALLDAGEGILAPLVVAGEPDGLIFVTGAQLTEVDLPAVTAFANHAAIALENTRLYKDAIEHAADMVRRVAELDALNAVAAIVNEASSVGDLLDRAIDETMKQTGAHAAAILLSDERSGELVLAAHRGVSGDASGAAGHLRFGETLAARIAKTGEPIVVADVAGFPAALKAFAGREQIKSVAAIPLTGSTGLIGMMDLAAASADHFGEARLPLLVALGRQIAIGIEKTRLSEEVRRHAERLEQRVAERTQELQNAQVAALNMMADTDEARRAVERANAELRSEIAVRLRVEAELARSNSELEQFAYVASHDLQEPLRKVQAFGDRLAARYGTLLDEPGSDYLARMQDAARRMQAMIQNLLEFSRVSTRTQPFTPVDLSQVAHEAVSDLEIRLEETNGRVEIDYLPTIDADRTQMRQLLENLIGNGLKFHREGTAPRVKVTGRLADEEQGEVCHLLVQDNGIGFDEKHLDRIFEPFQRLHGRGEFAGAGIGLAICRKIAQRHGGGITARSAPGKGATFIVTLPVKRGDG